MNATQGNTALDREPNGAAEKEPSRDAGARLNDYEKRQRELWQLTFLVLLIVSSAFAWLAWGRIRSEHLHLEVLPAALLVLVALLGVYVWRKTHEIAELKGLVRGLDHRDGALPSEGQIDQLFQMISKSQQGFRDLIDSFDDVLIAMTLEGEIRAVNRSFSDLVGLPFQQIIGQPVAQFLENTNGSHLAVPERALARFLERRQWSGIVELRVKGRNSVHIFECVAHAMIRDDQVHGLTVLARDITAMRRSEARFTELFETLQEGIYIVTPDDIVLEVNPALVRILGYNSKEELLGKKVSEIFVDQEQRAAITREVNRQPSPESREITLFRKDGQPVICLNTATAVRDTSGRIVRYQGALVDITERRAIEKRLYQQQEFARRLVDSFPDLILVVDANRHYTFVSPKVEEVLGYSNKEVVGMVFGDRTYPEEQGRLLALFDDLVTGRQSFGSIEIQVRHMNGTWRKLRCHFSPFFDVSGKIEGVVISGRDVTEMKRLEEQLIQAEKLAAMGQMLAGVAHELNNPLTAILGASELLRDRQGVDDSTKRQLEMTHRQARRAARIVQNLLEFSRPASPQKKQLDLNGIIDRTLQLHEHSLRRNSIEVDFQPASTPPVIVGDANQLIQVFLNLVTNAEQAIGEVRPSGHIQIRVGQAGSRVFVTVQDDGVGIKPETLPRLFDPFFTTKRPGGGTGLGLSICMSIAREHGGDIEAETVPGGGAAFTVFLPASAQLTGRRPPREVDTGSERMMAPTASLKGRALLVLDDEESIRMLLSESLTGHGLKVDTAATAEQALSLILANKYDAVLCDLKLAGTGANSDGYGVAQRLKIAAGANKPEVIFMSGDVSGDDGGMAGSSPARRLQKPFRVTDVLNLLSELWMRVPSGSRK